MNVKNPLFVLIFTLIGLSVVGCSSTQLTSSKRTEVKKVFLVLEPGDGIQYREISPREPIVRAKIGGSTDYAAFVVSLNSAIKARGYALSDTISDCTHVLKVTATPSHLSKDVHDDGIVLNVGVMHQPKPDVCLHLRYDVRLTENGSGKILVDTRFQNVIEGVVLLDGSENLWASYTDAEKRALLDFVAASLSNQGDLLLARVGL